MKKVLAVMTLLVVVLSIGTAIVGAKQYSDRCISYCLDCYTDPNLPEYQECLRNCSDIPLDPR